ncbi:MAG: putative ABC transporter permease [Candidatus Kerfeldbacteria bacterium]|nr:putative ABC transporter permease [Candidatus Kerfeldbacteria bacterium]
MNKKEVFFSFIFYSVFGWAIDSTTRSLYDMRWETGNALGIPFSPMYGIAAIAIIWIHPVIEKWHFWQQVVFYAVTAGMYEYSGGMFSEWFLGRRLWDYSGFPFTLGRYTDPIHALIWGLLAMFVVYYIHPYLKKFLRLHL